MSDWRDRLGKSRSEIAELSAEGMAATRIMKGVGASAKDIGRMCARLGIEYDPSATPFQRAVRLFREIYQDSFLVDVVDVRSGKKPEKIFDDLLDDERSGIVFFRYEGLSAMTSYVKGANLSESRLGSIVLKPGIRYLRKKGSMQLWEQEPVRLINSFSRTGWEE